MTCHGSSIDRWLCFDQRWLSSATVYHFLRVYPQGRDGVDSDCYHESTTFPVLAWAVDFNHYYSNIKKRVLTWQYKMIDKVISDSQGSTRLYAALFRISLSKSCQNSVTVLDRRASRLLQIYETHFAGLQIHKLDHALTFLAFSIEVYQLLPCYSYQVMPIENRL